jgi:hypothetical protein
MPSRWVGCGQTRALGLNTANVTGRLGLRMGQPYAIGADVGQPAGGARLVDGTRRHLVVGKDWAS